MSAFVSRSVGRWFVGSLGFGVKVVSATQPTKDRPTTKRMAITSVNSYTSRQSLFVLSWSLLVLLCSFTLTVTVTTATPISRLPRKPSRPIMLRSRSNKASASTAAAFAVRVVSYNVLSSHLASPSHFTTLNPDHLDASYRLPLVMKKLEAEIDSHKSKKVVFCLQEVSYDWAASFHTFFANRGYHLVTGLYGRKFNGYMGVALAYPVADFETVHVDVSRLSDKRVGGWPRAPETPEPSMVSKLLSSVGYYFWKAPLKTVGLLGPPPPEDPWSMSERRFNVLVSATLKDKTTEQSFCIGTYHMPCAFYAPKSMTIHSEMAARHVQDLADGLPYAVVGDWNIKPTDSMYRMLTTGKMDPTDDAFPTPKYGMEWDCTIAPLTSAYAAKLGKEPDFTNNARVGEKDPFIDTLDYIFLSNHWTVSGVLELPHRDDANGPFPNEKEPSDHVLIAADLEIKP